MKKKQLISFFGVVVALAAISFVSIEHDKFTGSDKIVSTFNNNYLSIPYDMELNGKTIVLNDIQLYQQETEHGYIPVVLTTVDASALDENDIYWMNQQNSYQISCSCESAKNNMDTSYGLYKKYEEGNLWTYIFYSPYREYKSDFNDNLEVTICVNLIQDDLIPNTNDHQEYGYNFYVNQYKMDITRPVKDISEFPSEYSDIFNDITGSEDSESLEVSVSANLDMISSDSDYQDMLDFYYNKFFSLMSPMSDNQIMETTDHAQRLKEISDTISKLDKSSDELKAYFKEFDKHRTTPPMGTKIMDLFYNAQFAVNDYKIAMWHLYDGLVDDNSNDIERSSEYLNKASEEIQAFHKTYREESNK